MGQRCEFKDLDGSYLRKSRMSFSITFLFHQIFANIYFDYLIDSFQRKGFSRDGQHCGWGYSGCPSHVYYYYILLHIFEVSSH